MGKQNCQDSSKTSKQSRRRRGQASGPIKSVTPLANRHCKLAFSANFSGTESAVGVGIYNFYRLNGPYDPDTAVLSNATPGLAALAQLYRSMRVLAARVEVSGAWFVGSNNVGTATLSLVPTAFQPVLPSNPSYWPVQPNARYVTTNCHSVHGTYPCGTFPPVRGSWKIYDVMNVTKDQYLDEADFATTTASNPTRQAYVAVAVSTNNAAPVIVTLQVRIEYAIEFYDPYPLQ